MRIRKQYYLAPYKKDVVSFKDPLVYYKFLSDNEVMLYDKVFKHLRSAQSVTVHKGAFSTRPGVNYDPSVMEVTVAVPKTHAEVFGPTFCRLTMDVTSEFPTSPSSSCDGTQP